MIDTKVMDYLVEVRHWAGSFYTAVCSVVLVGFDDAVWCPVWSWILSVHLTLFIAQWIKLTLRMVPRCLMTLLAHSQRCHSIVTAATMHLDNKGRGGVDMHYFRKCERSQ